MASHHLSCDLLGYDDIQRFMLLWTYLKKILGTIPCRGPEKPDPCEWTGFDPGVQTQEGIKEGEGVGER